MRRFGANYSSPVVILSGGASQGSVSRHKTQTNCLLSPVFNVYSKKPHDLLNHTHVGRWTSGGIGDICDISNFSKNLNTLQPQRHILV